MRNVWLGLLVAGTAACSSSATFEHRSELEFATRGVGLAPDGRDGVVGMLGTTCHVDVADARVGSDYNFPSDQETVHDNSTLLGEPAVVVISDMGAHVTYPERVWDWSADDFGRPGVVDGRIWAEGVVLLGDGSGDGCQLAWNSAGDVASLSVEGMCVGAGMAIDRGTGRVFVGNGDELLSATPEGAEDLGHGADLVSWDGAAEVLYAATAGDSTLFGLEADGGLRWSTDVGGAITGFDTLGALGQAVVMTRLESGLGALVTVDGFTGEITSEMDTPEAALSVETSDNGKTLALSLPREVHFFDVPAISE